MQDRSSLPSTYRIAWGTVPKPELSLKVMITLSETHTATSGPPVGGDTSPSCIAAYGTRDLGLVFSFFNNNLLEV